MIIRNTELAASLEKFEELDKRYREVRESCSPSLFSTNFKVIETHKYCFRRVPKLPYVYQFGILNGRIVINVQVPPMKPMKSLRTCTAAF